MNYWVTKKFPSLKIEKILSQTSLVIFKISTGTKKSQWGYVLTGFVYIIAICIYNSKGRKGRKKKCRGSGFLNLLHPR